MELNKSTLCTCIYYLLALIKFTHTHHTPHAHTYAYLASFLVFSLWFLISLEDEKQALTPLRRFWVCYLPHCRFIIFQKLYSYYHSVCVLLIYVVAEATLINSNDLTSLITLRDVFHFIHLSKIYIIKLYLRYIMFSRQPFQIYLGRLRALYKGKDMNGSMSD